MLELNPGPMSKLQQRQFSEMYKPLEDLNSRSTALEQGQAELTTTVIEVKKSQETIENKITDIGTKLNTVEVKISALDKAREELLSTQMALKSITHDNALLVARLDDFEDRSQQDNFFYNVADSPSETWAQTEQKVIHIVSTSLNPQITSDGIECAHKLGAFTGRNCRPVLVKCSHFKTKEHILSTRCKLKECGIVVNEDFSPAARLARKKAFAVW